VIATRDLKPLDLILSDTPVVVGPSRQRLLVCVECLKVVDGSTRCKDCNFPLCRDECPSENGKWHAKYECPFLSEKGFRADDGDMSSSASPAVQSQGTGAGNERPSKLLLQMSAITPLRLILRASKGIECSRDLRSDGLYDFHSDEAGQPHAASTRHSQFEAAMSEVLWEEMGIGRLEGVTKKTVATALRQLFNNAKSLEKAGNDSSGLYAGYALLNHACLANAKVVIGKDNYNLEVRAQTAITAGDEITTRYIGVNTGAPVRSEIIAQHWGFVCACIRCRDPTECGTYSSAILCSNCNQYDPNENGSNDTGLVLPHSDDPAIPAAAAESWKCNSCQKVVTKEVVRRTIDAGLKVIKNNSTIPPDIVLLEKVIKDLMTIYHPKHYLIIQVKFVLMRVLSKETSAKNSPNVDGGEDVVSLSKKRRLIAICNDILEVLDQLEPGMSPNRGRVLKELIAPVMTVSTHELKTNAIDQTEFKLRKMYCSKLAKDLIHCYKFEFI